MSLLPLPFLPVSPEFQMYLSCLHLKQNAKECTFCARHMSTRGVSARVPAYVCALFAQVETAVYVS